MPIRNAPLLNVASRKRLYQVMQPTGMTANRRMMLMRRRFVGTPGGGGDTTPPGNINVTSVTATKISRVVGQDTTQITFTADEAFVEYQVRLVPNAASDVTQGTLVEQATVP